MKVKDLKQFDDELEIVCLCDGGYIASTIHETKVEGNRLYCNIDINDDITESIDHVEYEEESNE